MVRREPRGGDRAALLRILLLNQYFHPDLAASAQIATDLAVDLAAAGHRVTVISGRATYAGRRRTLPARETFRGVEIRRVVCTGFGRGSLVGRLTDYATFFLSVFATVPFVGRNDVVLAMSTPPFIAWAAVWARLFGARRFVFWVQDVYPDIALELGMLKPGPFAALLRLGARRVLQSADEVVAIGEVMARRLADGGADPGRLRIVENWSDGSAVSRLEEGEGELAAELGLAGSFVVLYSGNLGNAHDFSGLEEAVPRFLAEAPDAVFVFVGEGAQKSRLERSLGRFSPRVRFLPYREREDLSGSLSLGAVHLVTQREGLEGLVVPSKLYGILAAGRPVLFLGPEETEVAERISRWDLGSTVPPREADRILEALHGFRSLGRDGRRAIGLRAREVFDRDFDRRVATARFRGILERAAGAEGKA